MDKLLDCVQSFEKLLDIQYRIVIGRKGKANEICIGFSKLDFHHLMGLGKLKDLRIATRNRETVFDEILNGSITYEMLMRSQYFHLIENRFQPLAHVEYLFDSNHLIFRYNTNLNQFSLIEADYLSSIPYENNDKNINNYFCRSFFPKGQRDYTKGQASYTMLYKEKIHLSTGEKEV